MCAEFVGQRQIDILIDAAEVLWQRDGSPSTADRQGNSLKAYEAFCLENGSSQGQNLVVTVLSVRDCSPLLCLTRFDLLKQRDRKSIPEVSVQIRELVE